jgi:hypothetical protein
VVDSRHRCPPVLRAVFGELRAVVGHFFPGRPEIVRLALSSFVIMRFFAAAILNPRLFALKREAPVSTFFFIFWLKIEKLAI